MTTATLNGSTSTGTPPGQALDLDREPVARGFPGLRCPCCGEEDSLSLGLDDLAIRCRENDCEITRAEVPQLIRQWQRVLAWLDLAPALPAE